MDLYALDSQATSPWIVVTKGNVWQAATHSAPLPVVASIVKQVEGRSWMLLIPVEQLLAAGILPHCYYAFIHTEAGSTFIQQHCKLAWLHTASIAWTPYGYLAHSFTHDYEENQKKN